MDLVIQCKIAALTYRALYALVITASDLVTLFIRCSCGASAISSDLKRDRSKA